MSRQDVMDKYEIVARYPHGDHDRISIEKSYADALRTVAQRLSDKHSVYRNHADQGCREFVVRHVRLDMDLKVLTTDADLKVENTAIPEIADNAVLSQPGLISPSIGFEYDEWLEMTGLDDSFRGSAEIPGTSDLYDASLRIRARANIGATKTIRPIYTQGDLDSYEGFVASSEDGDDAVFRGEGLSEDLRDAQNWAEIRGVDLILHEKMAELGAEDGISLVFDETGKPGFEVAQRAFSLDPYEG